MELAPYTVGTDPVVPSRPLCPEGRCIPADENAPGPHDGAVQPEKTAAELVRGFVVDNAAGLEKSLNKGVVSVPPLESVGKRQTKVRIVLGQAGQAGQVVWLTRRPAPPPPSPQPAPPPRYGAPVRRSF